MDDLLDDLMRAARKCERVARTSKNDTVVAVRERIQDQVKVAHRAWSGSWIGYHARVYIAGFDAPQPGERFDREWGSVSVSSNETQGRWVVVDEEDAKDEILRRANASPEDVGLLDETARRALRVFDEVRNELLPTLDAVLASRAKGDAVLKKVRDEIEKLESHHSDRDFIAAARPKQVVSRDSSAVMEGIKTPPHVRLEAEILSHVSCAVQLEELAKRARYLVTYLQKGMKMAGKTIARTDGKIFIGHGRSPVWRDLKDFIQDRLKLTWDEFDREPTAGLSTKERLEAMLDDAVFAFLVMTGEDEKADGTKQARANVIHEAGLFQGRLGFERAIILLEKGCEEFSNVVGLTQIRFPTGEVKAVFEEIRRVLEREGIIR
jgi:predicted nucleotide-binding protein